MDSNLTPVKSFDLKALNLAENSPYVVVAPTGTTVSPYPFERIKFELNRNTRFAILTNQVAIVRRHYHNDLGYIISDGKVDRFFEKSPSVVFCYPVVQYIETNDKGKPLSDKIQCKMLQCNKEMYQYICNINEIKGDITQFDFLGTQVPGGEKFKKYQLMEAGATLWKNNQDSIDYVTDYMKQNMDRFLSSLGKTYTEEKLEELLGLGSSTPITTEQDLDDIFKPIN